MNAFIGQILKEHIAPSIQLKGVSPVSGGCINNAVKVLTNQGTFFLKWNKSALSEMFFSEEKGLHILHEKSSLKVPKPLGKGVFDGQAYLLTEWIEKGAPSSNFWQEFAQNLAQQHKNSKNKFGLDHNNFIGSLNQSNTQHETWYEFFIEERLIPQIKLASSKNLIPNSIQSQFEILFKKLDQLIPDTDPALLHGDLWSGNFMIDQNGHAAIFDPSVHYGHRETELAFTQLFGGFAPAFYQHYQEYFPLEPRFDSRVDIHNLYPLLVHVNIFGSSYLSGIIQTLNRFV